MTPPQTPCDRTYTAVHHNPGTRDLALIKWIVLHDEEAPSALSAARYFTSPESGGSAHLCVDDTICYRCLDNNQVAWGAPGANLNGFHIEQAGYGKWSSVVWMSHYRTLQRAAYKTAFHCVAFNIPPVFADALGLKRGASGVTTHAECTKAFGGDHTDPGRFWPRRYFMRLVRGYYEALTS